MTSRTGRGRDSFYRLMGVLDLAERGADRLPRKARLTLLTRLRHGASVGRRAARYVLLRSLIRCGELVDVREGVYLLGLDGLNIGDRVSVHPLCYIDATGGVTIGNDTSIAHNVTIMSTEHRLDRTDLPIRDQGVSEAPVVIADDVWIGAGARILAGVSIGTGAVVAAGSVVTKDVLPRMLVAGVPARPLRERGADDV